MKRNTMARSLSALLLMTVLLAGCAPESQVKKQVEDSMKTWTRDVIFTEPYEGAPAVSTPVKSSIPAEEAREIRLTLTSEEIRGEDESFTSYTGGTSLYLTHPACIQPEDAELPGIQIMLRDYADFAEAMREREPREGLLRHTAYESTLKEPDFIYLSSWASLEVARADTQLVSYVKELYRYNREYEPDHYEVYGTTLDTLSGRKLSIGQVVNDIDALADLILKAILRDGRFAVDEEAFYTRQLIRSLSGERSDGSFAWCMGRSGLTFYLVEESVYDKKSYHQLFRCFLSFAQLGEILNPEYQEAAYDYIEAGLARDEALSVVGVAAEPEALRRGGYYPARIGGKHYLYRSYEEKILSIRAEDGRFAPMDECLGEFNLYRSDGGSVPMDLNEIPVSLTVDLLSEYMLSGTVRIDANGLARSNGYFHMDYYGPPITISEDLEALVFEDEEDLEGEKGVIPGGIMLSAIRSDGISILDTQILGSEDTRIYRLIVTREEDGTFTVNGRPQEEVIEHIGYWEE